MIITVSCCSCSRPARDCCCQQQQYQQQQQDDEKKMIAAHHAPPVEARPDAASSSSNTTTIGSAYYQQLGAIVEVLVQKDINQKQNNIIVDYFAQYQLLLRQERATSRGNTKISLYIINPNNDIHCQQFDIVWQYMQVDILFSEQLH